MQHAADHHRIGEQFEQCHGVPAPLVIERQSAMPAQMDEIGVDSVDRIGEIGNVSGPQHDGCYVRQRVRGVIRRANQDRLNRLLLRSLSPEPPVHIVLEQRAVHEFDIRCAGAIQKSLQRPPVGSVMQDFDSMFPDVDAVSRQL